MGKTAILTTIPSDAHSWNLVFLQMILEECGYEVVNLGICTPFAAVVRACEELGPELLVVSTLNGHGSLEGTELARRVSRLASRSRMKLVIGGKLGTDTRQEARQRSRLLAAGFDGVFCGPTAIPRFLDLLRGDATPADEHAAAGREQPQEPSILYREE